MRKSLIVLALLGILSGFGGISSAQDKVTIRLWDEFTGDQETVMQDMISTFEQANPGITIDREVHPIDETRDTISAALQSGTGPDVFMFDPGPASAGRLAKAGLLLNLDDAYDTFGWKDRFYPWAMDRVATDGHLYGVPNQVGFLGVYYNKQVFQELGVEPPATMDDLYAILDAAKAKGIIPLLWANKPGWPASNIFSELVNNVLGPEGMQSLLWDHTLRWDDPRIVDVIQMFFVDMQKAGYFPEGVNAIDYQEGNLLWQQCTAAVYPTGSWMLGVFSNVEDCDIGFFLWPSINGSPIYPPGGVDSAYFVSSQTEHPDEVLAFLDFLFQDERIPDWLRLGYTPPMPTEGYDQDVSPLFKAGLDVIANASQGAGLGYNIDVLTPANFNDVMYSGLQSVVAGDKTPEEVASEMQAAWEEAIAAGDVMSQ
jgi:raffinose/stachyose/melibiose transport system substrate-binding protein